MDFGKSEIFSISAVVQKGSIGSVDIYFNNIKVAEDPSVYLPSFVGSLESEIRFFEDYPTLELSENKDERALFDELFGEEGKFGAETKVFSFLNLNEPVTDFFSAFVCLTESSLTLAVNIHISCEKIFFDPFDLLEAKLLLFECLKYLKKN